MHCVVSKSLFAPKTSSADLQCTHHNSLLCRADPRPGLQLENSISSCVCLGRAGWFCLAGGLMSSVWNGTHCVLMAAAYLTGDAVSAVPGSLSSADSTLDSELIAINNTKHLLFFGFFFCLLKMSLWRKTSFENGLKVVFLSLLSFNNLCSSVQHQIWGLHTDFPQEPTQRFPKPR